MTSIGEGILVAEGGADEGEMTPLIRPTITMGRELDNDVVVSEKGVSRHHASLVKTDAGYQLRDLSSTNGTFLNGRRIDDKDHLLKDSDTIRLAASKVSHVYHSPTAETLQLTLQPTGEVSVSPPQAVVGSGPLGQPAPVPGPEQPGQPARDDDTYEGTVRLNIRAEGSIGLLVGFVQRLRENEDWRVLRLVGDAKGGVEAWLGLRQPVSLRKALADMQGVGHVSPPRGRDLSPGSSDDPLTVFLTAEDAPPPADWSPCVNCKELLEPGTIECPRCRKTQA